MNGSEGRGFGFADGHLLGVAHMGRGQGLDPSHEVRSSAGASLVSERRASFRLSLRLAYVTQADRSLEVLKVGDSWTVSLSAGIPPILAQR